jgi:hypothetical protein
MFPELLVLAIAVDAGAAERTRRGHHPAPPPEEDDDDDDDDAKPGPGGGSIDPDDDEGVDEDDDDDDDDTLWTGKDVTLSSQTAEALMKVGRCRRKTFALGVQDGCKMRFRPLVREPVKVPA